MALSDTLSILRSLYPQARVTSGLRNPNSALGRANPHSYHNVGQAFDVAPIPGVAFGDYVNRLKGGGVNVVEALDEASHPKPWTTGPNWHIAFGDAPQMAAQRKPRTLADMAQPQPNLMGQQMPLSMDAQPMQAQPASLGDLAQSMPQGHIKGPSKFNFGNIAGILGDALMAYGGLRPEFGPAMAEQQRQDQLLGYDREKLNAELQARRDEALAKAQEPPQWLQDAQTFNGLPQPTRQMVIDYKNQMSPDIAGVAQPNGSVVNQVIPRQLIPHPGDVVLGHVYLGGDPKDPSSWRAQ